MADPDLTLPAFRAVGVQQDGITYISMTDLKLWLAEIERSVDTAMRLEESRA